MRNAYFNWIVFCALALVLGCRTSSPDWNGAWRFNPSRSTFRGPVFTISLSTDGEYHYYDRAVGAAGVAFRCDGKYRPMGKNVTEACVKGSDTVLDMIRKKNGVKTTVSRWELSADDQTLTLTATAFQPSGPYVKGQTIASRISGSNGFAGQWEDKSFNKPFADMTLKLDSQRLHISYPNAGQNIDASLNGADSAMRGPHIPEGTTYAVRPAGRREFLILMKRNGKVLKQGSFELSDDGRVITDSWWAPGRPNEKTKFVYDKK